MPSLIDTLKGTGSGSTSPPPANLKPEPIEGNSLTQYLRSVNNRQSTLGENAYNTGSGFLQGGAGLIDKGSGIVDRGVQTYQQPLDYWTAILSGNKEAQGQAIGPYAASVNNQFSNASRAASTLMPRGGYRSTVESELPTQKAGLISRALLGLQPQAASQIQGIASQLAGIGLNTGQLGLGTGQLGLGEQNLGREFYAQLLQSLLGGRGQDITETGQNKQLGASLFNSYTNLIKP